MKSQLPHKVLYYIETPGYGGCEKHLIELIEGIDPKEYVPFVIVHANRKPNADLQIFLKKLALVLNRHEGSQLFQVSSLFSNLGAILDPLFWWNIGRIYSKGFAIIHFYKPSIARCSAALLISRLFNSVTIQTIQLPPNSDGKWKFPTLKLRHAWYLSTSDLVITVSDSFRKECLNYYGCSEQRVVTIHNSVKVANYEVALFEQQEMRKYALREFEDPPADSFILIKIARLDEQKGHRYLIEALRALRDMNNELYKKVYVLCCGSGPLFADLTSLLSKLDLFSKIKLVGYRDDVMQLLAGSDALILTSVREGLPLTVAEAMAFAKPVIATEVDGTPEIVVHESTGFLVPPANPKAITNAIIKLMEMPSRVRVAYGIEGRKRVEECFDHAKQTNKVMNEYRRLLN